ncbi:TrmH family RNA methyltransferase [Falsibacillus pallidus]|uniref:TrmH family RNA methyltransferase n=1 Tax=Falsibacillus pallidus TaxID=493781 RepID=UPI003D99C75A
MNYIQSSKNPQIKQWKKLLTKKERSKTGQYIIEGFHLVEEALKQPGTVVELMALQDIEIPNSWDLNDISITYLSEDAAKAISDTETPQGIFAVCLEPKNHVNVSGVKKVLMIDSVQDPGNLGTMIRTADAAGLDLVILGEGSADLYNPKVLRSAQGSHFHLNVARGSIADWIADLSGHGLPVYGTSLENGEPFSQVSPNGTFALIVGNEGSGVSKELLEKTDKNLYIPIYGQSESLNVAVAAGILMYYLRG